MSDAGAKSEGYSHSAGPEPTEMETDRMRLEKRLMEDVRL